MIREVVNQAIDHDPDFHWRGESVTRIENLSDIIFALALAMLVSSSEPPVTVPALMSFLQSIIPVSASFAILLVIWHAHYTYFRRYGLADGKTIFLNAILIFLVLFLAYPLRFIFDALFAYILALMGNFERAQLLQLSGPESAQMMAIYATGYGLVFIVLHRMYAHALKKAALLGLSEKEKFLTQKTLWAQFSQIFLSAIVVVTSLYSPIGAMAGCLWFFNWPAALVINRVIDPKIAKIPAD